MEQSLIIDIGKSIFEGAKFGDEFETEDGSIAIYFKDRKNGTHFLLHAKSGGMCYVYDDNGRCFEDPEWHCDIVCRHTEDNEEYSDGIYLSGSDLIEGEKWMPIAVVGSRYRVSNIGRIYDAKTREVIQKF